MAVDLFNRATQTTAGTSTKEGTIRYVLMINSRL